MTVLKGEGRVLILFGSLPLPVPPNRAAYIARPDVAGSFATVVIACDETGITPSVKALARHLARHGYAVLAAELRPDFDRSVSDLTAAVVSARMPGTDWADGGRLAVVGLGAGGGPAAIVAAEEDADVLALVAASLDADLLGGFSGRLLVLHGADDELLPATEVKEIQSQIGRGEWVLYRGVSGRFFEDSSEAHDPGAAADTVDRLIALLDARFGVVASV